MLARPPPSIICFKNVSHRNFGSSAVRYMHGLHNVAGLRRCKLKKSAKSSLHAMVVQQHRRALSVLVLISLLEAPLVS